MWDESSCGGHPGKSALPVDLQASGCWGPRGQTARGVHRASSKPEVGTACRMLSSGIWHREDTESLEEEELEANVDLEKRENLKV